MKRFLVITLLLSLSLSLMAVSLRSLGPNSFNNLEVPSAAITATYSQIIASAGSVSLQDGELARAQDTNQYLVYYATPQVWNIITAFPAYTITSTWTFTSTLTPTLTPTPTITFTPTNTFPAGTNTPTPVPTSTPTITLSPTPNWTATTTFTPVLNGGSDVVLIGAAVTNTQSGPITWTNGQATYDLTAHGFSVGDWVAIAKATPAAYDILAQITSTTTNTFTYAVPGNPVSPSTGTSEVLFWFPGGRQINPWKIASISNPTGVTSYGNYLFTFTNTQINKYFGVSTCGSSSGQTHSFGLRGSISYQGTTQNSFYLQFDDGSQSQNVDVYFYLKLTGIQ